MTKHKTRKCRYCKEIKDLSKFPSHKGMKFDKGYLCKDCNTEVCARSRLRKLYREDPSAAGQYVEDQFFKANYLLDELINLNFFSTEGKANGRK